MAGTSGVIGYLVRRVVGYWAVRLTILGAGILAAIIAGQQ